jgi:hypothetical protein
MMMLMEGMAVCHTEVRADPHGVRGCFDFYTEHTSMAITMAKTEGRNVMEPTESARADGHVERMSPSTDNGRPDHTQTGGTTTCGSLICKGCLNTRRLPWLYSSDCYY